MAEATGDTKVEETKKPTLKDAGEAVSGFFDSTSGAVWSGIAIGLACFGIASMLFG